MASNTSAKPFIERRHGGPSLPLSGRERRQFADSHAELSPDAQELGNAIDNYKLMHRRRFVTYEEMLEVIKSLGYHR
ncbi:MAG: hypothetical protein JSS27_14945 [Planctomycetes bacterium]|nr:hypothetical protein [Planctomycetota bacterium]